MGDSGGGLDTDQRAKTKVHRHDKGHIINQLKYPANWTVESIWKTKEDNSNETNKS